MHIVNNKHLLLGEMHPIASDMMANGNTDFRPRLALLLGDCTGIGPEIVAKVLAAGAIQEKARIVVVGDARVLVRGMQIAGVDFPWRRIERGVANDWDGPEVPLIDLGTIRLPRLIGHSRAMDLILTGREVRAQEAFAIGLANRLVPAGEALTAAIELARQIASFPQTCLRNDRLSAIEQWGMEEAAALRNEFRHGTLTMKSGESLAGASDFAKGAGRHGRTR